MRRGRPGQSDRLAEIVSRTLGPLSLEQAAMKLDFALSHNTISRLKRGIPGLEQTVRTFGEGFAGRICELYGEEVRERHGECNERTVGDWLAEEVGFRTPKGMPLAPGGFGSDQDFDVRAFSGAEGLHESDVTLINEVIRSLVRQKRQERGLE